MLTLLAYIIHLNKSDTGTIKASLITLICAFHICLISLAEVFLQNRNPVTVLQLPPCIEQKHLSGLV